MSRSARWVSRAESSRGSGIGCCAGCGTPQGTATTSSTCSTICSAVTSSASASLPARTRRRFAASVFPLTRALSERGRPVAATTAPGGDARARETLCKYVLRPPLAQDRVRRSEAGSCPPSGMPSGTFKDRREARRILIKRPFSGRHHRHRPRPALASSSARRRGATPARPPG